jgi:uncharacterized membrane protein
MMRWLRHLFTTRSALRRHFPSSVLSRIEATIQESETQHGGEIRFAIETAMDFPALWRGETARERAVQAFSDLGVWDTAANNGVLIYLLLADRDAEIVVDRGYAACVSGDEWQEVCDRMDAAFQEGQFEDGAITCIKEVGQLIGRSFPPRSTDRNELPNRPVIS